MNNWIDTAIVASYFVLVFIAGATLARIFLKRGASEFLTGGRNFTWKQTGLTMVSFAVDPTYMGMAAISTARMRSWNDPGSTERPKNLRYRSEEIIPF